MASMYDVLVGEGLIYSLISEAVLNRFNLVHNSEGISFLAQVSAYRRVMNKLAYHQTLPGQISTPKLDIFGNGNLTYGEMVEKALEVLRKGLAEVQANLQLDDSTSETLLSILEYKIEAFETLQLIFDSCGLSDYPVLTARTASEADCFASKEHVLKLLKDLYGHCYAPVKAKLNGYFGEGRELRDAIAV